MFMRVLGMAALFHGACAGAATLLAPETYLISGVTSPNRQPDGNSIVIEAPAGLIVFDTGRHPEHTQQILDFARSQNRPIAAVINSHWHLDHVGGNLLLRAAFPNIKVYASSAIDAARKGFLADYRAQLVQEIAGASSDVAAQASMRAEIALIDAGAALGPTQPVTASGSVTVAGRRLHLNLESRAVTAGDVWVFDRKTRVLLAGDLVTLPAPFFESACPPRWRVALTHLENMPFVWLVPGHGAPMHKEAFRAYAHAFANLLDCAAGTAPQNACIDGWVSGASALISSEDVGYARSLVGYYLDHYLRHPSAQVLKLCAAP